MIKHDFHCLKLVLWNLFLTCILAQIQKIPKICDMDTTVFHLRKTVTYLCKPCRKTSDDSQIEYEHRQGHPIFQLADQIQITDQIPSSCQNGFQRFSGKCDTILLRIASSGIFDRVSIFPDDPFFQPKNTDILSAYRIIRKPVDILHRHLIPGILIPDFILIPVRQTVTKCTNNGEPE